MFSADLGVTPSAANYIEDVFSTYLYTGNGGTQTITNGIDLAGNGGLVWIKNRTAAFGNRIYSTGLTASGYYLYTNTTAAQANSGNPLTFSSNGWNIVSANNDSNDSAYNYTSWTFRKQAKFFDVVTYTGNGANRTIAHNLGSVPGCIIIKATSGVYASGYSWQVYHRSLANTEYMVLDTTATKASDAARWNSTTPTATEFSLGAASEVNANTVTYVAYLFAHNAGGFGATGTDNVISCGSYTGTGNTSLNVNLGYEPQWIMVKNATSNPYSLGWYIQDNMRGMTASTSNNGVLYANLADAEIQRANHITATATGFTCSNSQLDFNANGVTFIYIAIRRGPMKTPTTGTSVFEPVTTTAANFIKSSLEAVDMGIFKDAASTSSFFVSDRLRGIMSYFNPTVYTNLTDAEATPTTGDTITSASSEGTGNGKFYFGGAGYTTDKPTGYAFRRAPGFFDVVCYTGTGSATTFSHNLGVAPELMIVKDRVAATNWVVYSSATGATKYLLLNQTSAAVTATAVWNDTAPTSSVFTVGTSGSTNNAADTFVAYLFATVAGVSKVGSYTGTGTTLQIDCGFTGGARFVLIKRTDSSGDWYVWDSARGIVAGNDSYLLLNSSAAEVTNTDYVDTYSAGFEISSTAPAAINANGGSFIFFAVA